MRTALRAAVSAVLARVFVRACSCLCGSLRAIVYALGGSSGWVSIVACRLFQGGLVARKKAPAARLARV